MGCYWKLILWVCCNHHHRYLLTAVLINTMATGGVTKDHSKELVRRQTTQAFETLARTIHRFENRIGDITYYCSMYLVDVYMYMYMYILIYRTLYACILTINISLSIESTRSPPNSPVKRQDTIDDPFVGEGSDTEHVLLEQFADTGTYIPSRFTG